MGDSTKEVSEEDRDVAQMHKSNAIKALSEGMTNMFSNFYFVTFFFFLNSTISIFFVTGPVCLTSRQHGGGY